MLKDEQTGIWYEPSKVKRKPPTTKDKVLFFGTWTGIVFISILIWIGIGVGVVNLYEWISCTLF